MKNLESNYPLWVPHASWCLGWKKGKYVEEKGDVTPDVVKQGEEALQIQAQEGTVWEAALLAAPVQNLTLSDPVADEGSDVGKEYMVEPLG